LAHAASGPAALCIRPGTRAFSRLVLAAPSVYPLSRIREKQDAVEVGINSLAHRDKFGRPTFGRKWVRRDETESAPLQLPITLPLSIRRSDEAFAIEDGAGRPVSYVVFDDDPARRAQTRRFTQDEAREIAQMIARLLTDVESDTAGAPAATIPLEDLNAENDE
jgi:hypothetical protein